VVNSAGAVSKVRLVRPPVPATSPQLSQGSAQQQGSAINMDL